MYSRSLSKNFLRCSRKSTGEWISDRHPARALLRIGTGLGADYGPVRIRPALSGTDYFDADRLDEGKGYYFFEGAQGQVVGRQPERPEEEPGRRCAGGILRAVVEIVAVRHERRAVHGGVSRTAHP